MRRAVGTYLEFALASKMAARVRDRHFTDDVDTIEYALRRVQLRVISGLELPHMIREWPPLVSGIGYCDQVNAAACQILSHFFDRAQLYALYDPKEAVSPHTIGRVWSKQRGEWLYFDAFWDRPLVFRRTPDGAVEVLNRHESPTFPERTPPPMPIYRLRGYVLTEFRASYTGYVVQRVAVRLGRRPDAATPPPAPAAIATAAVAPPAQADAKPSVRPPIYRRIAREYLLARADDIVGDAGKAQARYVAIASLPEASLDDESLLLRRAAARFVSSHRAAVVPPVIP